jgi:hypothetical protein
MKRSQSSTLTAGSLTGVSVEAALCLFRENVNRPNTIFSTDDWLGPKLTELRRLLRDPLDGGQAQALIDVLHRNRIGKLEEESRMEDLFVWLADPQVPWFDVHGWRREKQEAEAYARYLASRKEDPLEVSLQPRSCPSCGGGPVVPIIFGFPTEETRAAAKHGHYVLGGCCWSMDDPHWHCRMCGHGWRLLISVVRRNAERRGVVPPRPSEPATDGLSLLPRLAEFCAGPEATAPLSETEQLLLVDVLAEWMSATRAQQADGEHAVHHMLSLLMDELGRGGAEGFLAMLARIASGYLSEAWQESKRREEEWHKDLDVIEAHVGDYPLASPISDSSTDSAPIPPGEAQTRLD